jgi:L-seryl-tRNA(Ser) seleniumtransferase
VTAPTEDPRRLIPQVARLLEGPSVKAAIMAHGRPPVERAISAELTRVRALARGDGPAFEHALTTLDAAIAERAAHEARLSLVRVINATGVVVHTNLGRAPLSREIAEHVARIAASYSNLEYDLATGERGHRETHAEGRLRAMLRAEASVVLNNNAAAVLLAVNTLAEGREVLVSRGELVEIGGSFRIPDVIAKGGARLREVGTTNRTRISDFEKAVSSDTGLILRVHPSNFRIVGFTEAAALEELVALGRSRGIPVVDDLGSGLLHELTKPLDEETTIAASLAAGVDVVTASGDKLLGGPQAGLVVGRRAAIDALRKNPLYRALRVDKMTIAALDAVLALHDAGRDTHLPVPRMLTTTADELRRRAEAMRERLQAARIRGIVDSVQIDSAAGGGSAPGVSLPSYGLRVRWPTNDAGVLGRRLREATPPVIARIENDALLLDLRTVFSDEESEVERVLLSILGQESSS